MSSVLHPVGPEPEERYWLRRVAVLVAAVVALGVVIALVTSAMSSGSAVQADPAPPSSLPPSVPVTASESPSPAATASPSATPTPGATATPSSTPTASPTPTSSTSSSPGSTVTPDPNQRSTAEKKAKTTETDRRKAEQQAAEKKAAARKKAGSTVLATCPTSDLRPTLTGPKSVKARKSATFALSLINGSKTSCYLKVTSQNFTLTVISGKDRIWSTADCPQAVPAQSRKLATQKSLDWKVTWDGSRSGSGCSKRSEKPKAGYYWAVATFDDARAVRWRIILT